MLVKLEPEWQIQWIMSCLHHTWHHHGLILHGLIHLRHSWVSYPHNLLRYILHHHLRSRLHPHIILWLCLAKSRRHHHLRVLRSSPNSRVTHSSGSCYHLLLLHQVYWHGISTILNLNHLIRIRHGWRWHHWWCLMRHRSLLLSNSLLSKFSIAMSKRATIFVWAIFSLIEELALNCFEVGIAGCLCLSSIFGIHNLLLIHILDRRIVVWRSKYRC